VDSRACPLLVNFGPEVSLPRSKIEKLITRFTVVSLVRQTCWTAVDRVWCEKLATACSVMATVVNYLYFTVIGDRHEGIYTSHCDNIEFM